MGTGRVLRCLCMYLGVVETKEPPNGFARTTTRVFPLG
jgi:hypothetical protein